MNIPPLSGVFYGAFLVPSEYAKFCSEIGLDTSDLDFMTATCLVEAIYEQRIALPYTVNGISLDWDDFLLLSIKNTEIRISNEELREISPTVLSFESGTEEHLSRLLSKFNKSLNWVFYGYTE